MKFIQARNYTPTGGRAVDLIVLHSMEVPLSIGRAEWMAGWFSGATAPPASAHFGVDPNEVIRCVADRDVAWAAPGANHNGLHIEHAGYARQTRGQWLSNDGQKMLERSAALCRELCDRYDIPLRYVDQFGLARGERGITTHHQVSQAFKRSTHWDPGPGFPIDHYLDLVREDDMPSAKEVAKELLDTPIEVDDPDGGVRTMPLAEVLRRILRASKRDDQPRGG